MFPETPPVRKYRKCLHCRRLFDSSSAAERVCPRCRRKHKKLQERYSGVVSVEPTQQMLIHLEHMEKQLETEECLSVEQIDRFLSGEDVDDSAVYKHLSRSVTAKRSKLTNKAAAELKPPRLLSFVRKVIERCSNEEERYRKKRKGIFYW